MIRAFIRHGKYLTHTVIITDPVYLAEPMIPTTDFVHRAGRRQLALAV